MQTNKDENFNQINMENGMIIATTPSSNTNTWSI